MVDVGDPPDFTGEVTNYNRDRIGSIALWENDKENEKQPEYTGTVNFYNGEKRFKIALWKQSDKEEKEEPKETIPKFCKN